MQAANPNPPKFPSDEPAPPACTSGLHLRPAPPAPRLWGLLLLVVCACLRLPITGATIEYWVKPPGGGGGNGSSEAAAASYSGTAIFAVLSTNLGDDLVIYFLPGDYLITNVGSETSLPLSAT